MRASPFIVTLALALMPLGCPGTSSTGGDGDGDGDGGTSTPANVCTDGTYDFDPPPASATIAGGAAPDFDCVGAMLDYAPSETVTAEGCIEIFGIGSKAKTGLKLAVFSRDQDPAAAPPAYGEVDIAVAAAAGPLQTLAAGCDSEGYYRIEGIPTHERMIWKVFDTDEGAQKTAIDTYSYDVFFKNEEIDAGVVRYEANLIYRSTYDTIPTLGGKRVEGQANISDGIGRGVIAGEVHDCNDAKVEHAVVLTTAADNETKTAYFDGDVDDPSPDLTRSATAEDGLYVHLNVTTGDTTNVHTIVAGVLDPACDGDDCQCLAVGESTVLTYPDSVSVVTLRGFLP